MHYNQITYGPDLLEVIGLGIFGLLLLGALVLIICMIIGELRDCKR